MNTAFRNAQRNSERQSARIEHDRALLRVMTAVMRRHRAVQAVHGQRQLQALDDRHGVQPGLRAGSHAVTKPPEQDSEASCRSGVAYGVV
ncbi:MAG: hypothetical protein OXJ90_14065 [Spirochaetaceae bacterium]|nr:hypothetical protein [Spirochaetaceae bacterium]